VAPPAAVEPPQESPALSRALDLAELGDLPEAEVIRALRRHPRTWRHVGDLALQARASFARACGGRNLALARAAEWKAQELVDEIAGASPSPLERLLAERVATSWLELHMLDLVCAQELKPGVGRLDAHALEAADKRRGRAHRRYLAAIHELALVRRLLVPAVRVHIDQRRQAPTRDVTPAAPPIAALPPRGASSS
jgi:hypothetical protein